MDYWVLRAESTDGAIIDALPEGSPSNWKMHEGAPLASQFPAGGKVGFSDHFPDRRKLYDFVSNILGLLIVSPRVRRVVEELELDNVEFLSLTMCDHEWRPVADGYCILNVLGSQEAIDMEKSQYQLSALSKEIAHIENLVLRKDNIDPRAGLFRARNMMELFLMSDRVHEAFVKAGLTGFVAHPAEGFDDMFA